MSAITQTEAEHGVGRLSVVASIPNLAETAWEHYDGILKAFNSRRDTVTIATNQLQEKLKPGIEFGLGGRRFVDVEVARRFVRVKPL